MKKYFLVGILFVTQSALAENYIDILPLQLQYRYEETSNQSKDYISYQSYGAAIQVEKYRLGLDYSKHRVQTGNTSLNVETTTKDFILTAGYQVYLLQNKDQWRLDCFANGVIGTSEAEVNTNLLGATTASVGDQNPIFGLSASAVGRINYFMMEFEVRALNSKGFSPATVFTSQLKVGLSFSI